MSKVITPIHESPAQLLHDATLKVRWDLFRTDDLSGPGTQQRYSLWLWTCKDCHLTSTHPDLTNTRDAQFVGSRTTKWHRKQSLSIFKRRPSGAKDFRCATLKWRYLVEWPTWVLLFVPLRLSKAAHAMGLQTRLQSAIVRVWCLLGACHLPRITSQKYHKKLNWSFRYFWNLTLIWSQ